jgi:hypothetical protein
VTFLSSCLGLLNERRSQPTALGGASMALALRRERTRKHGKGFLDGGVSVDVVRRIQKWKAKAVRSLEVRDGIFCPTARVPHPPARRRSASLAQSRPCAATQKKLSSWRTFGCT